MHYNTPTGQNGSQWTLQVHQGIGTFVKLEDSEGYKFAHPKWLQRKDDGIAKTWSTARWIWSCRCLCETSPAQQVKLGLDCFCKQIFNRSFCMKCPLLHMPTEENKLQEVDLRLSQDLCICKEVFKHEESCFCGFGGRKHAIESSSKEVKQSGDQLNTDRTNEDQQATHGEAV
ncbi:hypothetical protein R1flu_000937 [Riccia fluitans]|uniref:Uncharacterized protein n=1 Tax=Riccia fluitans TaxID=41844 RepID=A0ABD1Y517_9MARC